MRKGKRVLIIDDDPRVVDALSMILGDSGYDTLVAQTGKEGLSRFSEQICDVAVVDLRLPDMCGLDVLSMIQAEDSLISVIVITGHFDSTLTVEAKRRGAFGVLPKPFSPGDILAMVRAATDGQAE